MKATRQRCAIYTRKSSEEGLEQDFNSLAAQREACEAYIVSQRGDGWTALATHYDDGGFSGGTLERPAVQQLLSDIACRQIDIVVVYKIDRLTRALTDFAKLIERFDAAGVSIVAVTQPFNTTTSMGRLTLNVLLSFAQFEREITGERIRDKIAASKQKGMWMGGCVPLGYDLGERELTVNGEEALIVRQIFERYLSVGTVRNLQRALDQDGIRSKVRTRHNGEQSGGKSFSRGALYALLRNRLYIGEISHQGKHYAGQHPAILDRDLFDAVQRQLDGQRKAARQRGSEPSLLAGKLFTGEGDRLTPSHTSKSGRRYRYYVSQAVMHGGQSSTRARWPAHGLEAFVRTAIVERLRSPVCMGSESTVAYSDDLAQLAEAIACPDRGDDALRALLDRATLTDTDCTLTLHASGLRQALAIGDDIEAAGTDAAIIWTVPLTVRTCHNGQTRIQAPEQRYPPNAILVNALINAHRWYQALTSGDAVSIAELARIAGHDARYVKRLLGLVSLAPDLKLAILDGRQPARMTLQSLTREDAIPIAFDQQRRRWGTDAPT
jgi:site-specific DNA recombinase